MSVSEKGTAISAVFSFLRQNGQPDLVARVNEGMEVQANMSGEGGVPHPNKPKGNWITEDGLNEWYGIRIPRDAATKPHYRDYPLPFDFAAHAEAIGSSGWHWVNKRSRWVGFDFDSVATHSGVNALSSEEMLRIREAVERLPYVEMRYSKSGVGVHLYVDVDAPASNHDEHKQVAKYVLETMSREAGVDLSGNVDCYGAILWQWHRDAAPGGFALIKEATEAFTMPIDWKPVAPKVDMHDELTKQGSATVDDLRTLLGKWNVPHTESPNSNPKRDGGVQFDLEFCPLCGKDEGNAAVWVRDGVFCFQCFRKGSGCNEEPKKSFADLRRHFEPKPVIDLSTATEKEIADQTLQALKSADIYQRGGLLCQIRKGNPLPPGVLRKQDSAIIVPIPRALIREEISEAVQFKKRDAKKKKSVKATQPGWLAENIAMRGDYPGVRPIEGISSVPLFLPDGSVLTRPGYHQGSGIYYAPDIPYGDVMSVPDALAALDDILIDFPFAKPVHKAATVSAILTLLARRAIPGHVPFFLIEANRAGCGKGLLADCVGLIGNGSPFARMTAPESEDEWRKRLTSVFMSGEPAVLLDNLSGKLKSSVLDAALTSDSWTDRLLGRNETVRVPATVVFLGTGNNLSLHPDTVRRVCHVRLATSLERPEDRNDCKYRDLISHVKANRGRLTAAALSLLSHFHNAGRPDQKLKPWGSFEGWQLIRDVLAWVGMPDPAETLVELRTANDDDSALHRSLMDGWQEAGGCMTAREAVDAAYDGNKYPTLRAAIEEIEGRNKVQALGQKLRQYMGCHLDGRHFERSEGRTTKWSVQT